MEPRINYFPKLEAFTPALLSIEETLAEGRIDIALLKLIKIRSSQINGCAACLHMHVTEALAQGEAIERIGLVAGFRDSTFFTPREKAALRWTEEVTRLAEGAPTDDAFEELRTHFKEKEIAELTLAISMINLWNRMQVSMRSVHPSTPLTRLGLEGAAE